MDPVLSASLLAALALFALFTGAVLLFRGRSYEIAGRLDRLPVPPTATPTPTSPIRVRPGRLSRLLASGTAPDLATDLVRADLRLTPSEYVLANLGAMVVGGLLAFFFLHQNLVLTLLGFVAGGIAPRYYIRYRQGKRLNAFDKQLGDTILLLSNSMRSGYSLLQSMETVARELKPPVSVEFDKVVREVGLGLTLQEALAGLLRRVPSDDLDFVVTAINIHYEVGGNLAEVLDTISHTIRERIRILGEIRTLTAQQRLSAMILSLLPVGLALLFFVISPTYISSLFQTTCGLQMVAVGGVLIVIGYLIIQRIATIQV